MSQTELWGPSYDFFVITMFFLVFEPREYARALSFEKKHADCTSQRLKRTSEARVMTFLCLPLLGNGLCFLY